MEIGLIRHDWHKVNFHFLNMNNIGTKEKK